MTYIFKNLCELNLNESICFLSECDKLRKDGFRSSQYYSQGPTFSDPLQLGSLQDDEDEDIDKKVCTEQWWDWVIVM